jgi:hypothetical protein
MNTVLTSQGFSKPMLEAAYRLVQKRSIGPLHLKKRLLIIAGVLSLGIAGIIGTLVIISTDGPQSNSARLLTIFIMLGSAALTLASVVALFVTIWGAYVYERIQRLAAVSEVIDASEQVHVLAHSAASLMHSTKFYKEVVNLIGTEFLEAFRLKQKHDINVEQVLEVLKILEKEIAFSTTYQANFAQLCRSHLKHQAKEVAPLIEEAEEEVSRAGSYS